MTLGRRVFVGLYAGSGAAALIYEVAWTRMLTLQLGHTVAAASTVLAAFMGGLAFGASLAGRLDVRSDGQHVQARRLKIYAVLELVVAAAALLLPVALAACVPALRWAYADGDTPARFAVVRVVISLVLLGVPAAAMGATFPIAAAWFAARVGIRGPGLRTGRGDPAPVQVQGGSATDAGILYAANTAGAALGAIAAGFFLIPALGLRGTTGLGIAINVLAAAGAFWLSTQPHTTTINAEIAEPAESKKGKTRKSSLRAERVLRSPYVTASPRLPSVTASRWLACAAVAISGFVALVYEVAWTRLLALVLGPTTYAFATMAAAFISGIAIGSAAGARLARRSTHPGVWLALTIVFCALVAAVAAWFAASRLPLIVAAQVAASDAVFQQIVFRQALGVALLLLPTTFALGAAFPLALAVAAGGSESTVGRDVAHVYTANTIGAISGALAGGFVLVPHLGLRLTFQAVAVIGALGGGVLLATALRLTGARWARSAAIGGAAAVGAMATIVSLPSWDRDLLASGAYKYAPYLGSGDLETVLRAGRLEYYKEGAAGTVSVRRLTGTLALAIDGKVDASNAGDMLTQRLLGLLPVLLHEDPREICVIGLGSGVTVGSALTTGAVRRADVVEISPEVVEASRFFDRESGRALQAPGVRLIVGDGRSHLLLTSRRYDVIVSEPSNPWMAGVAALFTREFFEAARARLSPDGLLCQWAHTYDISSDDLRSIVRTFSSVFPQGTMWLVGEGDLLLIGTNGAAIAPHLDRLSSAWRRGTVPAALADVGIAGEGTLFTLMSLFASGPEELRRYAADAAIQTDDRMALEFSAPRGIYGRMTNENGAAIRALGATTIPVVQAAIDAATDTAWATRGAMELKVEAYAAAYEAYRRAVTMNARNAEALSGFSQAAGGARRQDEARAWLQSLAATDRSNAPVRLELSRLLAAGGDFEAAAEQANRALLLAPDDPRAAEQLASVFADAGDGTRLQPLADALVTRHPSRPDSRYYRATALFLNGRTEEAAQEARRLVTDHPEHARGFNLLGAACATGGLRDCARAAFEASIRLNPHDPSTYVNLGVFLMQSGDPASAVSYFADALTIDPSSTTARDRLAQARAAIGGR